LRTSVCFCGLPPKADLPPDLRTTPAASSWRTPPSRPRASRRSRATVCGPHAAKRPASTAMAGLPARPWPALCLERSRRAPALWRRGEVQLDRLAAGTRARLDASSRAGLKDQRRDLLGAVDADPGAEQPAARAVATVSPRLSLITPPRWPAARRPRPS